MAYKAIARLDDVDQASMTKEKTYDGALTFFARKGKSLDLGKIHQALKETRLPRSGWVLIDLEITALGDVVRKDKKILLRVSGTKQQFELGEDPLGKHPEAEQGAFLRLQEALANGEKVVSVSGRIPSWSGRFSVLLKSPPRDPKEPVPLIVTSFETANK